MLVLVGMPTSPQSRFSTLVRVLQYSHGETPVLSQEYWQSININNRAESPQKARFRSVLRFEVMPVCLMDKLIQVMPVLALGSNLRQVNADDVQA